MSDGFTFADINSDGSGDLAYFDSGASRMHTALNDGSGHFSQAGSLVIGGYVFAVDSGILT